MLRGGPAKAATPIAGEPLATNASPGPLPSPISMLPAASACCTLASPPRSALSMSRPCLAKKPCSMPISTGRKVQAVPCALPTWICSLARAACAPMSMAAATSNMPPQRDMCCDMLMNVLVAIQSGVRSRGSMRIHLSRLRPCRPRRRRASPVRQSARQAQDISRTRPNR